MTKARPIMTMRTMPGYATGLCLLFLLGLKGGNGMNEKQRLDAMDAIARLLFTALLRAGSLHANDTKKSA